MPRCPNPRCQADYPEGTTQCTNPFCQCVLPATVIAGRYRIETLIGIGGMGAVYRASDTFEIEQVALKIMSLANTAMDMETSIERFRREARYSHQLQHKNIVSVTNFGQDGKFLYITMPLITGGTLKALLKPEAPLPISQTQRYLNELAEALDFIHQHPQQIVHRDIKPSNLLIHQDDGRLVITDFGIAKAIQQEKPLTQRGWSLGTEHYIAPEQEQGRAEPASDIYAMGVVAYQALTGLLPFQALVKSKIAQVPPPSTLNLALPQAIDTVIERAMETDPRQRYASGKDFMDAFNAALVQDTVWDAPTIIQSIPETMMVTSNANVIVRTIIPENPCSQCGRENRVSSRFCRHCGHSLDDVSSLARDVCQVGYHSDIGREVQDNEDMLLIVQGLCQTLPPPIRPFGLFAIADGLRGPQGTSAGGNEASRLAVETVADIIIPLLSSLPLQAVRNTQQMTTQTRPKLQSPQGYREKLEAWTRDAVRQANQVIYHCNADYDTNMASTLTVALLYKQDLFIASVGDSRAYHFKTRDSTLTCLTRDHTMAANLVASNLMAPEDIYTSPKRNQHYRYLGQNYSIPIDLFHCEVEDDDLILLCTDGLWHTLRDEQIVDILQRQGDTQALAVTLIGAANQADVKGNVSAIVARVK